MAAMDKLPIWANRLTKEFDGLAEKLPANVTVVLHNMDTGEGTCRAQFRIAIDDDTTDLGLAEVTSGGEESDGDDEEEGDDDDDDDDGGGND